MRASGDRDLILVFDVGTQSIRAALVDPAGVVHHLLQTPIEPYFSVRPGWAEQAPDYYWQKIGDTARGLLTAEGVNTERIAGVTITAQRATLVNLDRHGVPLRPAILWLDQRKAEMEQRLSPVLVAALKALNRYTGVEKAVRDCEANWIRQNQPEIWHQTHKFLFLSGFLIHRLTGEYRDSAASIVGYLPFDYKRHCWATSRDLKWKFFPMDPALLPELIPPGGLLGEISRQAAADTGIPAGLPVVEYRF